MFTNFFQEMYRLSYDVHYHSWWLSKSSFRCLLRQVQIVQIMFANKLQWNSEGLPVLKASPSQPVGPEAARSPHITRQTSRQPLMVPIWPHVCPTYYVRQEYSNYRVVSQFYQQCYFKWDLIFWWKHILQLLHIISKNQYISTCISFCYQYTVPLISLKKKTLFKLQ